MSQTAPTDNRVNVLFVCLGNICRSPMAEAVFRHIAENHPLIGHIESAGTAAYHIGNGPDQRAMATLTENGIHDFLHSARQVRENDFYEFDYILAMDSENVSNLKFMRIRVDHRKGPEGLAQVRLFGYYGGRNGARASSKGEEVEDPFYDGISGFETCYAQLVRFSNAFIATIEEDYKE